jgi:hypothetical protein
MCYKIGLFYLLLTELPFIGIEYRKCLFTSIHVDRNCLADIDTAYVNGYIMQEFVHVVMVLL